MAAVTRGAATADDRLPMRDHGNERQQREMRVDGDSELVTMTVVGAANDGSLR